MRGKGKGSREMSEEGKRSIRTRKRKQRGKRRMGAGGGATWNPEE